MYIYTQKIGGEKFSYFLEMILQNGSITGLQHGVETFLVNRNRTYKTSV